HRAGQQVPPPLVRDDPRRHGGLRPRGDGDEAVGGAEVDAEGGLDVHAGLYHVPQYAYRRCAVAGSDRPDRTSRYLASVHPRCRPRWTYSPPQSSLGYQLWKRETYSQLRSVW